VLVAQRLARPVIPSGEIAPNASAACHRRIASRLTCTALSDAYFWRWRHRAIGKSQSVRAQTHCRIDLNNRSKIGALQGQSAVKRGNRMPSRVSLSILMPAWDHMLQYISDSIVSATRLSSRNAHSTAAKRGYVSIAEWELANSQSGLYNDMTR
jgi:hypothetical protein